MRIPGFLRVPFAFSGDKSTIPEATQPGGQVSMSQGWGPDYQKDLASDPDAKAIGRADTNQLFNIITTLVQRWQSETFPEYIDATANNGTNYAYPIGAIVRVVNGTSWALRMSTRDGNTSVPDPAVATADWADASSALLNSVLRNKSELQELSGPLSINTGSMVRGAVLPASTTDKRIATMEWATQGKLGYHTTQQDVQKFPQWMSTDGARCAVISWGRAVLPPTGPRTFGTNINIASGGGFFDPNNSALTASPRLLNTGILIGVSINFIDPQNISINATVDQVTPAISGGLPVWWQMMSFVAP